jgi:hypothetical protein
LIEVSASDNDPLRAQFEMEGFISSANYSAKKTSFVLFINGNDDLYSLHSHIVVISLDFLTFGFDSGITNPFCFNHIWKL